MNASQDLTDTVARAYLYAYPMLFNYKTLYEQAVDVDYPGYVGGFGTFRHYSRVYTPQDKDIVTANNDTPYSWAWLDLRSEPWILDVPEIPGDRYVTFQWFDLFTYNFAYVGVLSTGRAPGKYLFAGPSWDGAVPEGIDKVFRSETEFIGCLGRTSVDGPDDIPNVIALQQQYQLYPLSHVDDRAISTPAEAVDWSIWHDDVAASAQFITYLNFLLQFTLPVHPTEIELFEKFAYAGIGAGRSFDFAALDDADQKAITRGIELGRAQLHQSVLDAHTSVGYFGTRATLGSDYLKRATAAAVGIYGNNVEEAIYLGWHQTAEGDPLLGATRYRIHFPADALPPVSLFWSITMYELPSRLLVENPIDRYSISDRTPGLHYNADGSLTLVIQHEQPGGANDLSNWLPAPQGQFNMIFRLYGPDHSVVDGTWTEPPITALP